VLTATSRAGYDALLELAGAQASRLTALPLAVLAPALAEHARARGHTGPIGIAAQAGDAALAAAVQHLVAGQTARSH
jgi:hypothetical protein